MCCWCVSNVIAVYVSNLSWTKLLGLGMILFISFLFALYKYQDHLLFQPKIYPQFATPEMVWERTQL